MRILIISNLFPPDIRGGYEILCQQVRDVLIQRGHQVAVLTSQPPRRDPNLPNENGPNPVWRRMVLEADFDDPAQRSRKLRHKVSRQNAMLTEAAIQTWQPDLVFMWSQLRLSPGPARAAEASGKSVAYTMNDGHWTGFQSAKASNGLRGMVGAALDATVYRDTTCNGLQFRNVTAISQVLLDQIRRDGLELEHAEVIHQGVPLESFPMKPNPGSCGAPFQLIYAGQLHAYKGVHHAIQAVHQLAAAGQPLDVHLRIAGHGPAQYIAELREQAVKGDGSIEFVGALSHAELAQAYRDSDALVFPSVWAEPFGLTFLEAMASGVPVIATKNGGQGEVLVDGEHALLVPPADTDAIAYALRQIIEDEELRHGLCQRGRKLVEDYLNLDAYVGRLEKFIADAIAREAQAAGKHSGPPVIQQERAA